MRRKPGSVSSLIRRVPSSARLAHLIPFLAFIACAIVLVGCSSGTSASFVKQIPGKHVYDTAGALSATQAAQVEVRAAAVSKAGAPTVVYLQARNASYDETQQDAADLMSAWNVESAPGAHDGVVMFLNLKPNDKQHGEAALYSGQNLVSGKLPQAELQRIYSQVMLPLLHKGDTTGGILAGLDAVQHDLVFGPPPSSAPSAFQRAIAFLVGLPLLIFSLLVALLVALLALRSRRPKPPIPPVSGTTPPSDLQPAVVGALVEGRVGDDQMLATLLELARRGILAVEPAGKGKAQVRILASSLEREPVLTGFEGSVFRAVREGADAEGIVSPMALGKIRTRWGSAKAELRSDLVARGWLDPDAARRRAPLYIIGALALILALLGIIAAAITSTPFGLIGAGILLLAATLAIGFGYAVSGATPAGEEQAAPWRAYLDAVTSARGETEQDIPALLDVAVPYAVAAGQIGDLRSQLKAAGAQGYLPLWLGRTTEPSATYRDFYPVWIAFVAATMPSSSGSGASAGAAAGGAGAGGAF